MERISAKAESGGALPFAFGQTSDFRGRELGHSNEGEVLESYVTNERDKTAALAFVKKAIKRHGRPEAIVTDGLRSYRAAMKEIGAADRQERAMAGFRHMRTLQKFTSVHACLHDHFSQERHLVDCQTYRKRRAAALAAWRSIAV